MYKLKIKSIITLSEKSDTEMLNVFLAAESIIELDPSEDMLYGLHFLKDLRFGFFEEPKTEFRNLTLIEVFKDFTKNQIRHKTPSGLEFGVRSMDSFKANRDWKEDILKDEPMKIFDPQAIINQGLKNRSIGPIQNLTYEEALQYGRSFEYKKYKQMESDAFRESERIQEHYRNTPLVIGNQDASVESVPFNTGFVSEDFILKFTRELMINNKNSK